MPLFPPFSILAGFYVVTLIKRRQDIFLTDGFRRVALGALCIIPLLVVWAGSFLPLSPAAFSVIIWGCLFLFSLCALSRYRGKRAGVVYAVLVMLTGLWANDLFVAPALSEVESGRRFVNNVESRVGEGTRIVFYRVNMDGDAVKYAFYSKRASKDLLFARSVDELNRVSLPFVVIASGRAGRIKEFVLFLEEHDAACVGRGLIHQKEYTAWIAR
jgi:hypothetical protein